MGWQAKSFYKDAKPPEMVVTGGGSGGLGGGVGTGGFVSGMGGGMGMGFMGGFPPTSERDRCLLAIKKSDLNAETTYESLEGKVEEIRY
jgi:hypothetical protein